jgi:hypothetical protein
MTNKLPTVTASELEAVATTALRFVDVLKSAPQGSKLYRLHHHILRLYLGRFVDTFWADIKCVSKACDAAAREDELGDIRKREPSQIPEHLKEKYHLEHHLPNADLRDLVIERTTVEEIVTLLASTPIKKVWLLRWQDKKLEPFKHGDPINAYQDAEIELLCD